MTARAPRLRISGRPAASRRLDLRGPAGHIGAMLIYKIFRAPEWEAFEAEGTTLGAPVDLEDGFIHFSTGGQVAETAARHFAGEDGLILAAVETARFGPELKWEPSRGGALFPHLYRELDATDVVWTAPLPIGPGGHAFPEGLG